MGHPCVVPSSLFFMHFVGIHVMYPYSSIDTATAWEKSCFILSERSNFDMIDSLSIAFHVFARHMLPLLSVEEILPLLTNFRGLPLEVEMAP